MGGAADVVAEYLEERYVDGASLADALSVAVAALGHSETDDRVIPDEDLEVAVLDRTRSRPRKFSRIGPARLQQLLGDRGPSQPNPDPELETAAAAADRARREPAVRRRLATSHPSPRKPAQTGRSTSREVGCGALSSLVSSCSLDIGVHAEVVAVAELAQRDVVEVLLRQRTMQTHGPPVG